MKITIHRGINQIGGCITEIATETNRIFIDFGHNLPNADGSVDDSLANSDAVSEITKGVDAIFYTHYHGDHLGLFNYVPDNISQYIGRLAKQVALCKHQRLSYIEGREELSRQEIVNLDKMIGFIPKQQICVGNITITPYFVSHSAYDAYMFLIEAEDKRVLHMGDFRGHGYLSKGLFKVLENHILPKGDIDLLITEGTMLSRLGEKVMTENELQAQAAKIMGKYKNVFVMCSSTDMERLASFNAANNKFKKRPTVCDDYQNMIFDIFTNSGGKYHELFNFDGAYTFTPTNEKLINWMSNEGFCMFIRPTDKFKDYFKSLKPHLKFDETVLIYSMWKEYLNQDGKHVKQDYIDFTSKFPKVEKLHTSGHASPEYLAEVCNCVNPILGIIPIHAEQSSDYHKLPIEDRLKDKIITTTTITNGVNVQISHNAQ